MKFRDVLRKLAAIVLAYRLAIGIVFALVLYYVRGRV